MTPVVLVLALAIAAAPAVEASEASGQAPLKLRSKAAVSAVLPAPRSAAPFQMHMGNAELDLIPAADPRFGESRSSCAGERSLCYDPASGRIVYKPARALMPEIPGLQRENISVKRDRITFRYSF